MVSEDALEGLTAGGLLVPGEGHGVHLIFPKVQSHPSPAAGFRSQSFFILSLTLSFFFCEMEQ